MPKKANEPVGNEHTRFTGTMGTKHNQRPVAVKLPPEIDTIVRAKDNVSLWLRKTIINQLYREGLLPPDLAEQLQRDRLLDLD